MTRPFADEGELIASLDAIRAQMVSDARRQADFNARVSSDLHEIKEQTTKTNGRVTQIELWKAETKGIAQGVGGTGRLLFYMLSASAGTGTIIVTAMKILGAGG